MCIAKEQTMVPSADDVARDTMNLNIVVFLIFQQTNGRACTKPRQKNNIEIIFRIVVLYTRVDLLLT